MVLEHNVRFAMTDGTVKLIVGEFFSNSETLESKSKIEQYQLASHVQLHRRDLRSVAAAAEKYPKKKKTQSGL